MSVPAWVPTACLLVLAATAQAAAPSSRDDAAHFEKEVRPLLIARCEKCHGPKKQEAGLRVDSRAALLKGGESGAAIVPGKTDKGTLLAAVRHTGELKMPPAKKLTNQEIEALTKWVRDGSVWPGEERRAVGRTAVIMPEDRKHWAFRPVADPLPPTVKRQSWPVTGIDRFILAKLESQNLKPVGLADKRTLLRRVTFDLTGLPPTTGEIATFLADDSPAAYAKVVDRLLASKHYGERWGRHWLDVARYADTAGDGADYPIREAYKYRNWVIGAFNADTPFDQFVREQIAGDILAREGPAEKYAGRVTATGFLAVGKRYGYNPGPDYQHLDFADAIESVGRSLMGLSLGCARCHDHKYEPVGVADYYAMYGILQSTKWAFPGGEEQKRPVNFPALVTPEEAVKRDKRKADELATLDGEIRRLQGERATLEGKSHAGGVDLGFESQVAGKPPAGAWLSMGPNVILAAAQSPFVHVHPKGKQGVRMAAGAANEGIRHVFEGGLKASPGKTMNFTLDFRAVSPVAKTGAHRLYLGRGVVASLAVECSLTANEFAVRNGAKWEVVRKLEPGQWYTLQLVIDPAKKTYSGVVGTPNDLTKFGDKAVGPSWDGVIDTFICDGIGHVPGPPATHDFDNLGLLETPFAAPGSKTVEAPRSAPDREARLARVATALATLTKTRAEIASRVPYEVAYGVSEGTPINARIQKRGEPDKPGDEVPRRFLEILGKDALPANAGSGRRELAEWIVRPSNPLTARVFVNRIWQWHFGHGLVPTPSDFGTRGDAPTHPELLDWLATRFVESGWSVKALHRLILHSRVYQLASADDASNLEADPSNRHLWKHSRRALDAESIRDAMLAAGGRLSRDTPGGHPFPDVNTWGYTIHAPFHAVYDSPHRSVYMMVQRNRRHPFLALFDAADPNLSTAERLPTITPTQALYLMNSPFVHEQSEALARRVLATDGDEQTRVRTAFEICHGTTPSEAEVGDAERFLDVYRKKLAGRGANTEAQNVGAWSALGRVLLTSNAFLYVD